MTDPSARKRKYPEPPPGPLIGPVPALGVVDEEEEEDGAASLPNCFMPHPDYITQSISELRQLQGRRDAELTAAENILDTSSSPHSSLCLTYIFIFDPSHMRVPRCHDICCNSKPPCCRGRHTSRSPISTSTGSRSSHNNSL